MMLSHNNEDLSAGSSRIRARRDHDARGPELLTVGPGYHSGPPGAREEAGLFRGEHRLHDLSVLAVLSAQPVRRSGALLIQDESERACPLAIQLPDGSSLAC